MVTDSRPTFYSGFVAIRRRRKCPSCKTKFTTYEISEASFHALTVKRMKIVEQKITNEIIERHLRKYAEAISSELVGDSMLESEKDEFLTESLQG